MALEFLLAIHEEEGLVLANRTADAASELIQIEFLWFGGEEALGVERLVAEKFEQRAMELIPAGLGGDKNSRAGAESKFSRVIVSQNLELLNRIDGGQDTNATGGQFVVVVAIQDPVGGVGPRAAD